MWARLHSPSTVQRAAGANPCDTATGRRAANPPEAGDHAPAAPKTPNGRAPGQTWGTSPLFRTAVDALTGARTPPAPAQRLRTQMRTGLLHPRHHQRHQPARTEHIPGYPDEPRPRIHLNPIAARARPITQQPEHMQAKARHTHLDPRPRIRIQHRTRHRRHHPATIVQRPIQVDATHAAAQHHAEPITRPHLNIGETSPRPRIDTRRRTPISHDRPLTVRTNPPPPLTKRHRKLSPTTPPIRLLTTRIGAKTRRTTRTSRIKPRPTLCTRRIHTPIIPGNVTLKPADQRQQ